MEDRTLLATFLVSNTGDSGPGSLRQAMLDSNAATGRTNTIDFEIAGTGVQTITPLSPLPAITGPVLIDGWSQPGFASTPLIQLSGSPASNGEGLTITGSDVTVRGLDINNCWRGAAIRITGTNATGNWIYGNFLGTDPTGTQVFQNPTDDGVQIDGGATKNVIGTNGDGVNDPAERNVIAGDFTGIAIDGSGTNGSAVAGNFIGTDVTGALALGVGDGVVLSEGASSNWIGVSPNEGSAVGDQGNVLSGAGDYGIEIIDGADANSVAGNKIGTDATGVFPLGNSQGGVHVYNGASENTIGGNSAVAGNLISDNGGPGVVVGSFPSETTTGGDQIIGNRIFGNSGQAIDLGNDGVTDNGPRPRPGPNNFQNYPIIFTGPDGEIEGWLGGSAPDTTFRIDIFASAGCGPGGAGEAQDYLGSLTETTDATGQVTFAIPFTAPSGLPVMTATATDPNGNTSELTNPRVGALVLPIQVIRLTPGRTQLFSSASGDGIAIQGANAGPPNLTCEIALAVSAGTLSLSSTAGLVGSGDQTASLLYSGTMSALNAALNEMTYAPPAGFEGNVSLSVQTQSEGVAPAAGQVIITTGSFVVTTTTDSGPGSVRQAIIDSNTATGGTNTIHFDLPGPGVETIALASPLPGITSPVLIDGTTQPGYTGAPLIAVVGAGPGNPDPLAVGSDVTVKGVAIGGASFPTVASSATLAIESVLLPPGAGGAVSYQIVVANGADPLAAAQAFGASTSLSLLDAQGHILMQSDGLSAAQPIDAIHTYVAPGTYSLQFQGEKGGGAFALTTTILPAGAPFTTPNGLVK
jgi:hypothetical protein